MAEVERHHGGHLGKLARYEESRAHLNRAIEIYASVGAELKQGLLMAGPGRCFFARAGEIEKALSFAQRAREIAEATGNPGLKALLAAEAEPLFYIGRWQQAIDVVDRELGAAWEFGNWPYILWCSAWATIAEVKLRRSASARSRIEKALNITASKTIEAFPRIYPLIALCVVRLADGQVEAALNAARQANKLSNDAQLPLEQGAAHRTLGRAFEARSDREEAEVEYQESLSILSGILSRPELAQTMLPMGASNSRTMRKRVGAFWEMPSPYSRRSMPQAG